MATQRQISSASATLALKCLARLPRMRALYWDGDVLYASRGYELLRSKIDGGTGVWKTVGHYQPEWWRKISSASRLGFRVFRDGFHAVTKLSTNPVVAAV